MRIVRQILWRQSGIPCLPTSEGMALPGRRQDAYSRQIVGWSMATHIRAMPVVDALEWRSPDGDQGQGDSPPRPGQSIGLACVRAGRSASRHLCLDRLPRRSLRQRQVCIEELRVAALVTGSLEMYAGWSQSMFAVAFTSAGVPPSAPPSSLYCSHRSVSRTKAEAPGGVSERRPGPVAGARQPGNLVVTRTPRGREWIVTLSWSARACVRPAGPCCCRSRSRCRVPRRPFRDRLLRGSGSR